MKKNNAKAKMLRGELAIGGELNLGSLLSTENVADMGFDFISLDNQHVSWNELTTMQAFRNSALYGVTPMTRVRTNEYSTIGRMLDMGALGLIIPMVETSEQAQAAVDATRYPPEGKRSGGNFATSFHGENYFEEANDEIFLSIQIETALGLNNAKEIMSTKGIDGCWIGPFDLAESLGIPFNSPEHFDAIEHIINVCKETNKIPGISCGPPNFSTDQWIEKGCLFVTAGNDQMWMIDGAKNTIKELQRYWQPNNSATPKSY